MRKLKPYLVILTLPVCLLVLPDHSPVLQAQAQNAAAEPAGEELSVEVEATKIRVQPRHWGASLLDLKYADRVIVVAREGEWVRVKKDGKEGYVHSASLTTRKVVLSGAEAGSIAIKAEESDIVLAGKGFNKQVEAGYSQGNAGANFAALDQALSYSAAERQNAAKLEKFVKTGGLTP